MRRHTVQLHSTFPKSLSQIFSRIADPQNECVAGIDPTGEFAWLVHHSILYHWDCSPSSYLERDERIVKNFTLPTFLNRLGAISPLEAPFGRGLLLVSKDGRVRWISTEANSSGEHLNSSLDLPVSDSVTTAVFCKPIGVVIGTSQGNLFTVRIDEDNLQVGTISKSTGEGIWGWSKYIWKQSGVSPGPIRSILSLHSTAFESDVLVLTSNSLQKWRFSLSAKEKLFWEWPLSEMVRNRLESDEGSQSNLHVWISDIQLSTSSKTIYVLSASISTNPPPHTLPLISYSLLQLHVDSSSPSFGDSFTLPHSPPYDEHREDELIHQMRFIVPGGDPSAYVYWPSALLCCRVPYDNSAKEMWELGTGSHILAAVGTSNGPDASMGYFFVEPQGVMIVTPLGSPDVTFSPRSTANQTSRVVKTLGYAEAAGKQFSEVFRQYSRGQAIDPSLREWAAELPGDIDYIVTSLSQSLLDAFPTTGSSADEYGTASSSLLLRHQLEDKKKRHSKLLEFLETLDILPSLSEHARKLLSVHSEKIEAALKLRRLQDDQERHVRPLGADFPVLPEAIKRAVIARAPKTSTSYPQVSLSRQDIFYSQVTMVDEILFHSQGVLEQTIQSNKSFELRYNHLNQVNEIFQGVLHSLSAFTIINSGPGNLPIGSYHIPPILSKQIFQFTLPILRELQEVTRTPEITSYLSCFHSQLLVLFTILLQAYKEDWEAYGSSGQAQAMRQEELQKRFEENLSKALETLEEVGNKEGAIVLAETFRSFDVLSRLCQDDPQRLSLYVHQFYNEGFTESLFRMYIHNGNYKELLTQKVAPPQALKDFLAQYPQLLWIASLDLQEYESAADNLHTIGFQENSSAPRKKTLLSLSKLSRLASAQPDASRFHQMRRENEALLTLLKLQDRTPLASHPEPQSPEALIQSLLSQPRDQVDEQALEVALSIWECSGHFLSQRDEILRHIWDTALRLNPWDSLAGDWERNLLSDSDIETAIQNSIFFQLATQHHIRPLLTSEILESITKSYSGDALVNSAITRLMGTLSKLLGESPGIHFSFGE